MVTSYTQIICFPETCSGLIHNILAAWKACRENYITNYFFYLNTWSRILGSSRIPTELWKISIFKYREWRVSLIDQILHTQETTYYSCHDLCAKLDFPSSHFLAYSQLMGSVKLWVQKGTPQIHSPFWWEILCGDLPTNSFIENEGRCFWYENSQIISLWERECYKLIPGTKMLHGCSHIHKTVIIKTCCVSHFKLIHQVKYGFNVLPPSRFP